MNETEQHNLENLKWYQFADGDIASAKVTGVDADCVDLAVISPLGQVVEVSLTKSDIIALAKAVRLNLTNNEDECNIITT